MKWTKMGKIFDPTKFKLPNNCLEFAQSPQVLLFDERIRVYFSTRERDAVGKYISHIAFVDFDKKFNVVEVSKETVLTPGKLGCYDEHGVFPMNVLRVKDKIMGYIGGWNRKTSVSVDGSIGLAVSTNNGKSFNRIGDGPILSSSLKEPFLIGDPFVQFYGSKYHMWYIFGSEWKQYTTDAAPDRIYKIAHAESMDGIQWNKCDEGVPIISNSLGEDESQALPTVIKIQNRYHMLFCYRESSDFRNNRNRGYRLGHAYSDDLIHWTRSDEDLGISADGDGWDSDMMCYPHLFEMNGEVYLMYNGNEFGRYGFGLAKLES